MYTDRIIEGTFYADINDTIVRDESKKGTYLSIEDEVFLPLKIEDNDVFFVSDRPILIKASVDGGKIEQLRNSILGMTEPVQIDVDTIQTFNAHNLIPIKSEAEAGIEEIEPESESESESEAEADDEFDPSVLDGFDDDETEVASKFVYHETHTEAEESEESEEAEVEVEAEAEDYTAFGKDTHVETTEFDPMAEAEAEKDLDQVIFHEAVVAKKRVYKVRDQTNLLTDLIQERHQLVENINQSKLTHLMQSLAANYNKTRTHTIGQIAFEVGLPNWIVPVACSELVQQGDAQHRDVYYRNGKGGYETEFDIPYPLVARADRMITDKIDEVPGTWFQARRDYGINMIHLIGEECTLKEAKKQSRRPLTEYNYLINLNSQQQSSLDAKKAKERSALGGSGHKQGRLKCGQAYANALVEPNAVKSITVTKQTRATNKLVGVAIYEPGKLTGTPRIMRLRESGLVPALDSIIETFINKLVADSHKFHNLQPVETRLRTLGLGLHYLPLNVRTMIDNIISSNNPDPTFQYCDTCARFSNIKNRCECAQDESTDVKPANWSDFNKQLITRHPFPLRVNTHPKRASIDHGQLYFLNNLLNYVRQHDTPQLSDLPSPTVAPTPTQLLHPRAIQHKDNVFYYRYNDGHYTRQEYKEAVRNDHRQTLRDFIRSYPDKGTVERNQQLLQLAYGNRKMQIEHASRRLLSGLVIDIVQNVPEAGLITRYLNKLLELDSSIYLTMLDQFMQMGVVVYNEHYGRFVVADTNDMVICICHYTQLNQELHGNEHFIVNGKCRYCNTTLITDEQLADPTSLTGRDMYAGDIEEVEDDTYISLETLLGVMLEHINEKISERGWIINANERDRLLDSLKHESGIIVDPYGRQVARQAVDKDSGDLRSFVQLRGQVSVYNRPIVKGQRKTKGYALDKKYSRESVADESSKINFVALIYRYLQETMKSTVDIEVLLKNPQLDPILKSMSKDISSDSDLSVIKNTGLIMSFFTLPILKSQANNMSIILGHIISLLELKYGIKQDNKSYLTNDGDDIEQMLKRHFTLPVIHKLANQFSEQMFNKYEMTLSIMQSSGLDANKARVDYFKRMSNMFNNIMPNGEKCFNAQFTEHFEILFRAKSQQLYEDELSNYVTQVVQKLRRDYAAIYDGKPVGVKPLAREKEFAMWYDVAPTGMVGTGFGATQTISEYQQCRLSAQQKTYTGYLEELREGYNAVSEVAKGLSRTDDKDDLLVTVGYLAQSQKLLEEPAGEEVPEWKQEMSDARGMLNMELHGPEKQECEFMPEGYGDIDRNQQLNVSSVFHTIIWPLRAGRYNLGSLSDRSLVIDPYDNEQGQHVRIKLDNLQKAYTEGLEEVPIADLFSDNEDATVIVNDHLGQQRQNYAFGTIPRESKLSIQLMHNERAKKAREMQRIIKHMTNHTKIPDWMRGDDDIEEFKPWGPWDNPSYNTDLTIRSIRRIQNLGVSLVKILRWLGTPASETEMDLMHQYIQRANEGNIIGADAEFKSERDHLDALGYVLKDLFDIKLDLVKNPESAEQMKLADYESHFIEMYQMSYNEYQELTSKDGSPDGSSDGSADGSTTQMRNLVNLSLRTDLIKHAQYIGVHGQSVRDFLAPIELDQIQFTGDHHKFIITVAKVLNALIKHGGPEIIDPDRSEIDWRYEERFKEFANKRKVTTARTVKKDVGININTIYAGAVAPTETFMDDDDADDDYDPLAEITPEGYDEYDGYEGEEDPPEDERLGDEDADVNMFEGEVEEEYDPMMD